MDFTPEQRAFLDHVQERMGSVYHQVSLRTHFDLDNEVLTFYLWNMSGQIKGFLEYKWKADKVRSNDENGRYRVITEVPVLYGLEFLNENLPYIFLCEGVFDAFTLMTYGNAVAVLSNEAPHLEEQIALLPGKKIAICDGDKPGLALIKYADDYIVCPEGQDPNSMLRSDLKALLGDYAIERDFFRDTFRHWWDKQGILLDDPTGR